MSHNNGRLNADNKAIEVKLLRLGERLAAIAGFIKQGSKIVDVGTDHAYLPIYLVEQKKICCAVAGEVNRGPYLSAQAMLKKMRLTEQIKLRLGDGLAVIEPGEVDTAVIAGMGGPLIVEILNKQLNVTASLTRLVLQPMIAASLVRKWLIDNGWAIIDEALVREEGRLYEIIVAEYGEAAPLEPALYEIGPMLWEKKPPLIKEHIARLLNEARSVVTQMESSQEAVKTAKYQLYLQKIREQEAKDACL
jgi:tRNA (adenine22-N1)-methyltransferase